MLIMYVCIYIYIYVYNDILSVSEIISVPSVSLFENSYKLITLNKSNRQQITRAKKSGESVSASVCTTQKNKSSIF